MIAFFLELNNREPVAQILSYILSPIGQDKHPFKWTDNEFLGAIEKEIFKIENNIDEE